MNNAVEHVFEKYNDLLDKTCAIEDWRAQGWDLESEEGLELRTETTELEYYLGICRPAAEQLKDLAMVWWADQEA